MDIAMKEKCITCGARPDKDRYNLIKGVHYFNFTLPILKDIPNRTDKEEYILSIMADTLKIEEALRNIDFYKDIFECQNEDELKGILKGVGVIKKNGHIVHANYSSDKINIVNHRRYTTDVPRDYQNTIYIFGKSVVYGYGVEDKYTIASYIQRFVNTHMPNKFRVVNMGVAAITDEDVEKYILHTDLKKGDIIINILHKRRCYMNDGVECTFGEDYIDTTEAFKNKNPNCHMFFDSVAHFTRYGCETVSKYIYDNIKEALKYNILNEDIEYMKDKEEIAIVDTDYSDNEDIKSYIEELKKIRIPDFENKNIGAIVMNCNPFTLGHKHLITVAAKNVDYLYVFVVQEDKSYFPFADRIQLVRKGCTDISNVCVYPSGCFMISSLTFPEYFTKEKEFDITVDTTSDLDIFCNVVAKTLGISVRFAGEEPTDYITRQYNENMAVVLPRHGIDFIEIKRRKINGVQVSASTVRKLIQERKFNQIKDIVPESTYEYIITHLRQ